MIGPVAHELDSDILQAVNHIGGTVDTVEEITTLRRSRQRRGCFRLRLADGRTVKGRLFRSTELRESVTALHSVLEGLPLSRILAVHGVATIEEWVPGVPVDPRDVDRRLTHDLAAILGTIHCRKTPPDYSPEDTPDVDWHARRLRTQLAQLADRGHIDSQQATRLIELAVKNQPSDLESGIIHTDFHLGNMIRKHNGEIWIVDNERLRFGVLDYDLARCWRYWPMAGPQREMFCKTYSAVRSLDTFLLHQPFWSICSLVNSLRVYMRHRQPCSNFLEKLDRISRNVEEPLWPVLSLPHLDSAPRL